MAFWPRKRQNRLVYGLGDRPLRNRVRCYLGRINSDDAGAVHAYVNLLYAATVLGACGLRAGCARPGHDHRDLQRHHHLGRRRRPVPVASRHSGSPATAIRHRRQKNSESDWLDFGGAAGGGIETSLGMWGNSRVTGSVKGFLANIETDDRKNCTRLLASSFDPATGLASVAATARHQDQPRCRLLGRPSRAEIRARRAGAREAQSLPQRLFHRRRRRARHRPGQHAAQLGWHAPSPTQKASIPPMPAAISASAANTASASSRASRMSAASTIGSACGPSFPHAPVSTTPTPTMTAVSHRLAAPIASKLSAVDRRARLHRHHLARDPQADRHAHQPVAVDRLRVHLLGAGDALCRRTTARRRIDDDGVFASRTMLRLNIGLGSPRSSTKSR